METVKEKKPAAKKDKKPAAKREAKAADKSTKVAATKKTKEDAAASKSKCKYIAVQILSISTDEPPVCSACTITDQISRIIRPATVTCSLRLRTGRGILMAGPEQFWLAAFSPLKFDPSIEIDTHQATRFRLIN